jgi:hypothetical protein
MITNQPQKFESAVSGAGPVQWFGADVPDGDREPWATAPIGSQYCRKTSTSVQWYDKRKADNADNDWALTWGEIRETVTVADFTDGTAAVGTVALAETLPIGAWVLRTVLRNVTGFTGNTSAVLTVGDGTDVDRYNTGTPSVFTTATAIDMGAPSGTQIHATAATVTLTITAASDFTAVTAGTLTVSIYYLG